MRAHPRGLIFLSGHTVPNRNVIVSGYQKGGGIGGIFGVFGVLAEDAVETRVGEGSVNNVEAALHIDLTRMLTR
jgi:hypothetical protein